MRILLWKMLRGEASAEDEILEQAYVVSRSTTTEEKHKDVVPVVPALCRLGALMCSC